MTSQKESTQETEIDNNNNNNNNNNNTSVESAAAPTKTTNHKMKSHNSQDNSGNTKNFKNLTIQAAPQKDDDMKCQCPHYFNTETTADPLLCSENVPSTVKSVSPGDSCTYGTHYPNRIFVGHLPGKTNATDLADFFRTFGTVLEGKVVLDSFGRSRRFGFVTFATQDDVQKVLSKCPFFFKGKKINVGPAVKKMFGAEFSPPASPGPVIGESGSSTSESSDTNEEKDTIITVPPVNEAKDPATPNTPKSGGNIWLKVSAKPKMSPKKDNNNNNIINNNKSIFIPAGHFVYPTTSTATLNSNHLLSTSPQQHHQMSPYQTCGGAGGLQFFYPPQQQQYQPAMFTTSNNQQNAPPATFPYNGTYYAQSPVPYYENGQAYFLKPVTHYGALPVHPLFVPGSLSVA